MFEDPLSPRRLDQLLASVAAGSADALGDLYQAVSPGVYSYALSILQNTYDAEDILQECFLSIQRNASQYHSCGKPMAWIITITKNLCIQHLRSKQHIADLPPDDWQQKLRFRDDVTVEDKLVIHACLRLLSENQRQVIILHIMAQLKFREISQILNIPLSTVLSSYRRGLQKMKEHLSQKE